jgi:cyclopropane-fatty-acyl-phospholipid synthase
VHKENIFTFRPGEKFDAVVILGVMEHLPDYQRLLSHLNELMTDEARVYMDFAATRKKFELPAFAFQYIFEGNHTPVHMPGLVLATNESPYEMILIQNDRLSYFLTLKAWARNLDDARDQLVKKVGLKVYRVFQLYLWSTASALLRGRLESYRVVLQKSRGRDAAEVGLADLPAFAD